MNQLICYIIMNESFARANNKQPIEWIQYKRLFLIEHNGSLI